MDKRIRIGDDIDLMCKRCGEQTTHRAVAVSAEGKLLKLLCNTCGTYRKPAPSKASKKRAGSVTQAPVIPAGKAALAYDASCHFNLGDVLSHPRYGLGQVMSVLGHKITVQFNIGQKVFIHRS